MVHDEALDAQHRRQHKGLTRALLVGDAAGNTDDVPQHAEVAHVASGGEQRIGDGVAAELLELMVGPLIEARNRGTEMLIGVHGLA